MQNATILMAALVLMHHSKETSAQAKAPKVLTDSSMALGYIKPESHCFSHVDQKCNVQPGKYIDSKSLAVISGVFTCNTQGTRHYFKVFYNNKEYFINQEDLITDAGYFEQISKMNPEAVENFKSHAGNTAQVLYLNKLKEVQSFLEGCKVRGLMLLDWSVYDESEYTQGTSIKIRVHNPTLKTIKYLWFTFLGLNPVGDKVTDKKRGTNITMQGVGPIKPSEEGTYEFSYVWFTDMVDDARIVSIKVQYMDGSVKVISKPSDIILSNDYHDILTDGSGED